MSSCVCICKCASVYVHVLDFAVARCGIMPEMSRDAELHTCWAVNHDPYNPVLLSQHDKPVCIHWEISEKTPCQPRAANSASHFFFNIYSLNNIFLESKSWYYAKNRRGSDKKEKGNLATQQFFLYQETSCSEINGPCLKAVVWITRGSNKENNTLTKLTKPWWTSLVPLYPLMQL